MDLETYKVILETAGVLIAGGTAWAIIAQLGRMVEANKLANAMAVVTLEQAISGSRKAYMDAALLCTTFKPGDGRDGEAKNAELAFNERCEQFLNDVERLCTYIRRGLIDEATYRKDYRKGIDDIVSKHKDKLGPDTRHPNILAVHLAWSQDKSAIDR